MSAGKGGDKKIVTADKLFPIMKIGLLTMLHTGVVEKQAIDSCC